MSDKNRVVSFSEGWVPVSENTIISDLYTEQLFCWDPERYTRQKGKTPAAAEALQNGCYRRQLVAAHHAIQVMQ